VAVNVGLAAPKDRDTLVAVIVKGAEVTVNTPGT
jgi:hypothetical protein